MADYAQKSPADKANTSAKTPSPVSPEAAGLGIEPFTHTPALQSAAAAIALQRSIGNQRIQSPDPGQAHRRRCPRPTRTGGRPRR